MKISEKYNKEVVKPLMEELGIKNVHAAPRINKVTVNVGIGSILGGSKDYSQILENITNLTGQKPTVRKARISVSNFKIREGMPVGIAVTLRGKRMDDFLTKLVNVVLPRVRDFRGISARSFDKSGNYSLGFKECTVFPEVNPDNIEKIHGLQINISTTADNKYDAYLLLKKLGFPFKDEVKKPTK